MILGGGSASTGCQCFCTSGSDKELETVRLASCSLPPCGCGLQFSLSSSNSGLYNPQKRPNTAFHRGFCHRLNKKRFFTVKITWLCARCKPSGYPLQSSLLGSAFFIRVNTSLLTNKQPNYGLLSFVCRLRLTRDEMLRFCVTRFFIHPLR